MARVPAGADVARHLARMRARMAAKLFPGESAGKPRIGPFQGLDWMHIGLGGSVLVVSALLLISEARNSSLRHSLRAREDEIRGIIKRIFSLKVRAKRLS